MVTHQKTLNYLILMEIQRYPKMKHSAGHIAGHIVGHI